METRLLSVVRVCVILALLLTLALSGLPPTTAQARTDPDALIFIENAGQFAGSARFQVRGRDLTLWLAEDAIWLTVLEPATTQSPTVGTCPATRARRVAVQGKGQYPTEGTCPESPRPRESGGSAGPVAANGVHIKLSFPGANAHPRLEPFARLETRVSFFTGSDPAKRRAGVPAWGGVRYVELYPGIDLELSGEQGQLVPRLVARRGVDMGAVRLRVEGAGAVTVLPGDDTLRLSTAAGDLTWPLLRADGSTAEAAVQPAGASSFDITTPFARSQHSQQSAIPTAGSPDSAIQNPESSGLLYGTFLGGSLADEGQGIAVDETGRVYVTGLTWSSDLPTTPGAFDTSLGGNIDAFVIRLNATGSALDYATFLGGSGDDGAYGIAVDTTGRAYVTGVTTSDDLPTTPGAFDTSYNGVYDAFVVKLNATGSALDYATFLGGEGYDLVVGIAVDGSGTAYVTGVTDSADLPTTPGAFDTSLGGGQDAFVAKLNAAGSALDYATFLGRSDDEKGYSIAVDGTGKAYVTGYTESSDFPTTPGAFDTSHNGESDAFVARLAMVAAYSISGRVTDAGGEGVVGVTVSAGPGGSAVTGANGDYVISGVFSGTYTLTPVPICLSFDPVTRTVSVPPDASGQDFIGEPVWCFKAYLPLITKE